MREIDIHMDFACPFAYLGGTKLIQATEDLDDVKINFRSYQLNPNDDNTKPDYLQNRMDASGVTSRAQYIKMFDSMIGNEGKKLGLNYDPETVISANSYNSHLGLQFAKLHNKDVDYFKKMMSAHWEQGLDYSDMNVVKDILASLDLDTDEFEAAIPTLQEKIKEDINLARKRGITGTPTFVYKNKMLSGTGSKLEFLSLLSI